MAAMAATGTKRRLGNVRFCGVSRQTKKEHTNDRPASDIYFNPDETPSFFLPLANRPLAVLSSPASFLRRSAVLTRSPCTPPPSLPLCPLHPKPISHLPSRAVSARLSLPLVLRLPRRWTSSDLALCRRGLRRAAEI